MFGAAIRCLERYGAVSQGRTHLNNRAVIARPHALERGHCSVDESKVGNLRGAAKFVGCNLPQWSEDGGHGVIYPDVNRAELLFHTGCSLVYLFRLSYVRW